MDHSADPDRFTTDSDDAYESQEAASSPTSPFGRWLAAVVSLGASDLLPQVHERPRFALIASTLAGVITAGLLVYAIQFPA